MNFKIGKIYLEWQQQISTNDKTFYLHKITFTFYIHFLHEINILKFKFYLCWEKKWNPNPALKFRIPDNLWKTAGSRIRIAIPDYNCCSGDGTQYLIYCHSPLSVLVNLLVFEIPDFMLVVNLLKYLTKGYFMDMEDVVLC